MPTCTEPKILDTPPDFTVLRAQLIELIEAYSSGIWTDYNTHDPGLTIGEHLLFGITETLHLTQLPVADILEPDPDDAQVLPHAEFPAEEILVCRPTNLLDFRKILIDLPGVYNAWFEETNDRECVLYVDRKRMKLTQTKPTDQPVERMEPRGFYKVRVAFEDHIPESEYPLRLKEIRKTLEANRNLCELFLEIEPVAFEEIGLCVDIEIEKSADVDVVMAAAFYALERFISPTVRFYTLQERLDSGLSTEEIFHGPLLKHGFIDDDELADTEPMPFLRASDLIQILMDVPGVIAVKSLIMTRYQDGKVVQAGERWSLPLDTRRAARLSLEKSRFLFFKGALPFSPTDEFEENLQDLRSQDRFTRHGKNTNRLARPEGSFRRIQDFATLQNEFPLNYGIGRFGLPPSATELRKAQALQLKAYLLILETYLSSSFTQIANLRRTFSLLEEGPMLNGKAPVDVYQFEKLTNASQEDFAVSVQSDTETGSENIRRRDRMLNHLLARFAEDFSEYALIAGRLYGQDAPLRLIRDKIAWLLRYPELSAHRFAAFDITGQARDRSNVSGMEKRIATLLGLSKSLGQYAEYYDERDEDGILEIRFRVRDSQGAIILSSATRFPSIAEASKTLHRVSENAGLESRYRIKSAANGKYYFLLADESGSTLAHRIEPFETEAEAKAEVLRIVAFLRRQLGGEPFHILEHILLRPGRETAVLLPICDPETDTDAPYSVDPYSFRITIAIPAWPERFRDVRFRHFMERFVREQTPAHIYPKICWLDELQMNQFEGAYYPWREALSRNAPELPQRRDRLVLVWQTLRSQFPKARLHGCVTAEEENPVILDNAALGELEDPEE